MSHSARRSNSSAQRASSATTVLALDVVERIRPHPSGSIGLHLGDRRLLLGRDGLVVDRRRVEVAQEWVVAQRLDTLEGHIGTWVASILSLLLAGAIAAGVALRRISDRREPS
jgi:hypothetical protein